MAVQLLTGADLGNQELLNARLQNLAADPTGFEGRVYYNTVSDVVRVYAAGVWGDLAGSMSANDILESLKTVDGAGSGLDADLLDGANGATYLDRANHTGAQAISTVTGLQAALDAKVDDTQVGAANGVASLGADAKVPSAQLPALALTDVNVVADIAARDALTVEEGDVAVVTGTSQTFIYDGAAWQEMVSPTDGVTAVTGTGNIASSGGTTPQISFTGQLPVASGGTGATTAAAARTNLGATTKVAADVGNASATSFVVTHSLNTRDVQVTVRANATPYAQVITDVEMTDLNTVTVRFATAPASAAYRVIVVG